MAPESGTETAPSLNQLWELVQQQQARIAELEARDQQREAELQQHRLEKLELQSRVAELRGGQSPKERRLSRAGLLKAAAAGAAGLAGAGLVGKGPDVALASSDVNFLAYGADSGATTASYLGFYAPDTSGFEYGVFASGRRVGVEALGTAGSAAQGMYAQGGSGANGSPGVPPGEGGAGVSAAGGDGGRSVTGFSYGPGGVGLTADGGYGQPYGVGIRANSFDNHGVEATTSGTSGNGIAAVYAHTNSGFGVHAIGYPGFLAEGGTADPTASPPRLPGRGGRFASEQAQIRLMPSSQSSPPTTYAGPGDFFVTSSGSLWYYGSAGWQKLAT